MTNALVKFDTDHGQVELSKEIIKRYLVAGDPSKITDQEMTLFMQLCKYQRLNPFLREAYLIKYGDEQATIVTGKDTFVKRAANSSLCKGFEAGVIVQTEDKKLEQRDGTLVLQADTLVGGWARVHRTDWDVPLEITVNLHEYEGRKRNGDLNRNWAKMPATMIRKVALVQALREAMPEEYEGLYSPEEVNIDDSILCADVVDTTPEPPVELITKKQAKELFDKADGDQDIVKSALSETGYSVTSDVRKSDFKSICGKIEVKKAEKLAKIIPGDYNPEGNLGEETAG